MIEEVLWKVLAFIVAVVLIFLAPLQVMYDRQEAISYSVVFSAVGELTDLTRDTGRLDEKNFGKMMTVLNATGVTYEVSIEHYKKNYVPIYDSGGVFTGTYHTSYEGVFMEDVQGPLESTGTYDMDEGDLFYVQVENRSKTPGQVFRSLLYGGGDYPVIVVRNGGMIRHEPN